MKLRQFALLFASVILCPVSIFAADIDDTSIIDELEKNTTEKMEANYSLESFDSCDAFEDVIEGYMKTYWENSYKNYQYRNFWGPVMMETESMAMDDVTASPSEKSSVWSDEISLTNTQVLWVDEADIVKTDGDYHYYFNQTEQAVFIVEATGSNLELVKKIKLPSSFYGVELYIDIFLR